MAPNILTPEVTLGMKHKNTSPNDLSPLFAALEPIVSLKHLQQASWSQVTHFLIFSLKMILLKVFIEGPMRWR